MNKLSLHTCCAPCLAGAYDYLKDEHKIELFWFNPHIFPKSEYRKRFEEVKRYAKIIDATLEIVKGDYDVEHSKWLQHIAGFGNEPEGGKRCKRCFEYRLKRIFNNVGNKQFSTTLTISPHKKASDINKIGKRISKEYVSFNLYSLGCNKKSLELSKEFNIYRQKYCGCEFSIN
jgi:epoxyqueuosine reductase